MLVDVSQICPHRFAGRGWMGAGRGTAGPRGDQAGLPGSPKPAKRAVAGGVERLLSIALRFFPRFECMRLRRFQVLRVFEAMAGRFLSGRGAQVKPWWR